jgi:hypothetical protein
MLLEVKKSFHRAHEGRLFPGKWGLFVKYLKMSRNFGDFGLHIKIQYVMAFLVPDMACPELKKYLFNNN